ncbi:MAG: recombination protein RecR [Candidatus Niyogibacteria bacterium CG10_big_fil_rev_8_21_14_0_10_46_36]|uniref:Recombination protein RecR n=1 Tax=Candidatus Niyogibacteria bacterium CG10_big_fil_rev_8_21_14_0_10_46_36 TaxID=1974726 RepID=A0A2H0TG85_9BACT|nr:MAG: recombination protein RecR [Candidatus Niyogibacteria bacterium CG10_big_fil_rev_8_21_14_0_10_46_36]
MSSERIEQLVQLLSKLPGLGPRQASRLVYHLLDEKQEYQETLARAIVSLAGVKRCAHCFQAYEGKNNLCLLCASSGRDKSRIMVVEKDMDFSNIERAGVYDGLYHILGGAISPLRPKSQEKLRLRELYNRLAAANGILEVVLATSATPEGDHTARYIEQILEPFTKQKLKITRLGRGLSTGSELEYSDTATFKSAYLNRK